MAGYPIEPAFAPLPTPWNLPFQLSSGSQTSNLTAGLVTAATRQKAGSPVMACDPGGVNGAPRTSSADVIFVSGNAIDARSAHDPCAGAAPTGVAGWPNAH